jgi:hypothetical protein
MSNVEIAWLSDLHCGSPASISLNPSNEVQEQLLDRMQDARSWYGNKPDYTILLGDLIDGLDKKSHDLDEHWLWKQCEDAAALITEYWIPKKEIIVVSGTPYHTCTDGQDWEREVCVRLERNLLDKGLKKVKVSYRTKLKAIFNGWYRIEARHKVGRSTVPYGRKTAPERYKYWNVINAAMRARRNQEVPSWPHLCVFAHVHYWGGAFDTAGSVMTLPCWQALGSLYGDTNCEGAIDVGMVKTVVGATEEDGARSFGRIYDAGMVDRWEHK